MELPHADRTIPQVHETTESLTSALLVRHYYTVRNLAESCVELCAEPQAVPLDPVGSPICSWRAWRAEWQGLVAFSIPLVPINSGKHGLRCATACLEQCLHACYSDLVWFGLLVGLCASLHARLAAR